MVASKRQIDRLPERVPPMLVAAIPVASGRQLLLTGETARRHEAVATPHDVREVFRQACKRSRYRGAGTGG